MVSNKKLVYLLILFLLFVIALIFLDLHILFRGVPLSVYFDYANLKNQYSCGKDCSYFLQTCSEEKNNYYKVSGWQIAKTKMDNIFDSSGNLVCSVSWPLSSCRSSSCFLDKYSNCPNYSSCVILIGSGDKSLLNFPT